MYHNIAINIIVVLFLCTIVIWINLYLNRKYSSYILGVIFGLITIFAINEKAILAGGYCFDFKHITMTMAGFIGGPVTAVIASFISCLYRFNLGGSGLINGIVNIIVFGCFGSILGNYFKGRQNGGNGWFWFAVGIVMACILLLVTGLHHFWKTDSIDILSSVAIPYLIITPMATTIIFNYYFWSFNYLFAISELKQMQAERIEQLTNHLDLQLQLSQSQEKMAQFSKA